MKWRKEHVKWIFAGLVVGLFFGAGVWFWPKSRPNIIFILVDTLRADALGCYGFEGPVSPHMDELASQSILFRRCLTQAPWTKPSVASLFTSLYPQTHGVVNHPEAFWFKGKMIRGNTANPRTFVLSQQAFTLAEALKGAGYQTAGFSANPWISKYYGFDQGFDFFAASARRLHDAAKTFAPAKVWLEKRNSKAPFFLYLHFMDTHGPYQCEPRDVETWRSHGEARPGSLAAKEYEEIPPYLKDSCSHCSDTMKRSVSFWRACYAAGVHKFDRRLGQILRYLSDHGFLENTILVLTSDHGEELFEHEGWDHGYNLHFHQLHVPLLIRLPDGRHGGRAVSSLVRLFDINATLLRLAHIKEPSSFSNSENLVPLWKGRKKEGDLYNIAEAVKLRPSLYSIEDADYKLLYEAKTERVALYHWRRDPRERNDISSAEPSISRKYLGLLKGHIRWLEGQESLPSLEKEIPPQDVEELKSLGYL